FFYRSGQLRALHAFPTRRSSDLRMHRGELSREALQLWVANRFYYQINIPVKDALILANCPEHEVRQQWIRRIVDQNVDLVVEPVDRKSTRLNSSHGSISYAVFCL